MAYERLHAQLLVQCFGEHIAIYNGQVVDHDPKFERLHVRIRQKYGNQPVLLRRVEPQPERELMFRSPRMEKS